MKITAYKKTEIEVKYVRMVVGIYHGDDDMPFDFPFRKVDTWDVTVDIDSGRILAWPEHKPFDLHMKVCDSGSYYLIDQSKNIIASIKQDYVPNRLIPGEYGDYIELKINEHGVITNWPKKPDLSNFLNDTNEVMGIIL